MSSPAFPRAPPHVVRQAAASGRSLSDDQLAGLERAFGILEGDLSLSRDQIAAYAADPRRVAVLAGTVTTHDACTGASWTADAGYAVEVVVRYKSESDGADRGAPCTETMVVGRDDDIGSVGACTVCPPLEKQLVWLFTMPYRKVFRRFKGARTSLSEAEEKIAAEKTSAAIAALFSAPGALLMNRARDRKCGLMRLACNALATGHQLLGGIVVGGGEGGEQ